MSLQVNTNANIEQLYFSISTQVNSISPKEIKNLEDPKKAAGEHDNLQNKIDAAIDKIDIGAYKNKIVMDNQTTAQSYSASKSVIKDTDMAQEVMSFTKNQILQQSGMAMLAQANSIPQQVLSLLGR
jgi:flagellin